MLIAFWPHTRDLGTASFRLRCHQIVLGLAQLGISCGLFDVTCAAPRVLVLSKRYDKKTIDHAIRLRQEFGTKLVLDICDNHFYRNIDDARALHRADALRHAVKTVDGVITSTDELAKVIACEAGQPVQVFVIGDAVEQQFHPTTKQKFFHPVSELNLGVLSYWLRNKGAPKGGRLIWFGNHGSGYADGGMSDLLRVKNAIEDLARTKRVSLTVVSNSRNKFRNVMSNWMVPSRYVPWNYQNFSRVLMLHDISIIPVGLNPFTVCKTNNRIATSLVHGLAVVADSIPSYREFADSVELDNWKDGLEKYVSNPEWRFIDVTKGNELVRALWNRDAILERWRKALFKIME